MSSGWNFLVRRIFVAGLLIALTRISFGDSNVEGGPVCPGHKFVCAQNQTCCELLYGRYGCCPYPNAVCCSDRQSCCPNGYQCNVTARTCTRSRTSDNEMVPIQLPEIDDVSSNELSHDNKTQLLSAGKKPCPDQQQSCPDTYTCCEQASGGYGCCPLTGGICCPDKVHCCPMGTTCNTKLGSCDG